MSDETYNADDIKKLLLDEDIAADGVEIAVISGARNKAKFQITAIFYYDYKRADRISTTVERTTTRADLPDIIKKLKEEYIKLNAIV